jgi:hypothetical protein
MSRIKLNSKNPEHEVFVGLDKPLSTFFISVTKEDEDKEDILIEFKDFWARSEVLSKIDEYAIDDHLTKNVKRAISLDLDPEDFIKDKEKNH